MSCPSPANMPWWSLNIQAQFAKSDHSNAIRSDPESVRSAVYVARIAVPHPLRGAVRMTIVKRSGTDCPAWRELEALAQRLSATATVELFAQDPQRFGHFSHEAAGLGLDYSRQRVDARVLAAFTALADQLELRARIEAMFRGDPINSTEGRAVLHTALRSSGEAPLMVDGTDINALVLAERERVLGFAEDVRQGRIRSSSDANYSLVVNIGIGGSDLGPAMAVQALKASAQGAPQVAFVSNVDGCQMVDVLENADPARTLFIICSKTFTTLETLTDARAARSWIQQRQGEKAVPAHFAAVSVNTRAMDEFGVHPEYRFAMWDWVGGRYSLWSAIGVSLAIAIGREGFESFLSGAREIDENFRRPPGSRICRCSRVCWRSGTSICWACPRWRCCLTTRGSRDCPPICSSSRWRAMAST